MSKFDINNNSCSINRSCVCNLDYKLTGAHVNASMLFFDLRGSTAIAKH